MIEVSVIITTKNEKVHIRNCLQSVIDQDFDLSKIEIIVVDNNSVDNTKAIANEFTKKIYNFGPERSAQRNFGVKNSGGKYILYLDADMILSKNIIADCVKKCEKENYIGIYIPEKIIGNGFWIRVRDFERSFYDATVIDCVRFVRRDAFEKVHGFDESLTGPEDWDFDRKISEFGKTGISSEFLNHNEGEFALKKYLNKKSYYARNFDKYIDKWGRDDKIIKKQFGFLYRYFGVFVEKGKWLKFIRHPFLVLGVYYLRFLVGFSFLINNVIKRKR